MTDRAAKLRTLIECDTTPLGDRTAALRALTNLKPTSPASLAQQPSPAAKHGHPGRWEDDAQGQPRHVFNVERRGAGLHHRRVRAGGGPYVVECRVQGVRLRPRYEPSQVVARVVGLAAAPVASLSN